MTTIAAQNLTTNHLIAGQGGGLKPQSVTIRSDYVKVEVVIGGLPATLFYRMDEQVVVIA
jgi:hypothetical protein